MGHTMTFHEISKGLKARGRYSLLGHLGTAVGANILYLIISMLLSSMMSGMITGTGVWSICLSLLLSFIVSLFAGILEFGLCSIYTGLQYAQPVFARDLFRGFRETPDKIIRIQAVRSVVHILCTVPALVSSFSRSGTLGRQLLVYYVLYFAGEILALILLLGLDMSFYLLLDYPDMSALRIMKTSYRLMKGNRLLLLYLYCSFLPLQLLSLLSLGVAGLWVIAYRYSVTAAFYRGLIASRARKD